MPFAAEAEIPLAWECKVCRAPAALVDGSLPEPKKGKPPRTAMEEAEQKLRAF